MAHLSMPALTPVPAIPSVMSPHEHVHHRVGHLGAERLVQRGAAVVEEERHAVVGVQAGGDDDVELGHLLGDPLDPRQVTAQADHGRVDDRADALGGQRAQLGHRVGDPGVLAAPLGGVVLLHVRGEHEDVLVHVGRPEVGGVDRAADGGDLGHSGPQLPLEDLPGRPLRQVGGDPHVARVLVGRQPLPAVRDDVVRAGLARPA